jgi:hypothetical protein
LSYGVESFGKHFQILLVEATLLDGLTSCSRPGENRATRRTAKRRIARRNRDPATPRVPRAFAVSALE